MTRPTPHPDRFGPDQTRRLRELEADEALDQLSVEERHELDELRAALGMSETYDNPVADLLRKAASGAPGGVPRGAMPSELRDRLIEQGRRIVGPGESIPISRGGVMRWMPWAAAAACVALAGVLGVVAYRSAGARGEALARATRAESDLAKARVAWGEREGRLAADLSASERRQEAMASELRDATTRLAEAASRLEAAEIRIASFESSVDPEVARENRRRLLEMPGTFVVAWKPFDLPDSPAEQRQVAGDVVWNDQTKKGFLRFVGLKPNDPKVEQYQVWVIDERGLEQKVSGGVFNASAEGEVVIPITPGIDVRKVAMFAVTIEEPGGTWVPSLKRRVVVAPREG